MRITENAVKEILEILKIQNKSVDETYLRVGITGARCSGPIYSFNLEQNFDEKSDDLFCDSGLRIVNDKQYTSVLEAIIIDYAEVDDKKGFTFKNPLTVLSCGSGCGACSH